MAGVERLQAVRLQQESVVSLPLGDDFLQSILSADESTVLIPLPGGGSVQGRVSSIRRDAEGLLLVQGAVIRPEAGHFMFQRQTSAGKAGALAGFIYYDLSEVAYQVRPLGESGAPVLVETTVHSVVCRAFAAGPGEEDEASGIPATHPTDVPIPPQENGIIQLESLPGATAVIYLDYDGEARDFEGWGTINALPYVADNSQIFKVWQGVCEDYQPFQINVTTVRSVYDAAPPGHRIQVIITPTTSAAPGYGGVAYIGSFNWTGDMVCWAFLGTGKNAVEVISHEVGHTLGLSHDGLTNPYTEYYTGHNGWAPIMGSGYSKSVTQWSKGEYPGANNQQDDLRILANDNNGVAYRADDHGSGFSTASWLDIAADGTVSNEGIIGTTTDRDSFRFSTGGGAITLQILPIPPIPYSNLANLDIKAEILNPTGAFVTTIAVSDSSHTLTASFSNLVLPAGDYFLRISGSGRGDANSGYTDYGSLGSYTITGTVVGGVHAERFTLAENPANGAVVGSVASRADHGGGTPSFAITSGDSGGAFVIDATTGVITVADAALLNFEAQSSRWDDPADFELFVTITDSYGVLTESIRTVVNLLDVNEAPVFPMPSEVGIPENLASGMRVITATATDPDRGDIITYAIVSGNEGGLFGIDPGTGVLTLAGTPDLAGQPVHHLVLRATDHRQPVHEVEVPLAVHLLAAPDGFTPGSIVRTFYEGIEGYSVADLTESANFPDKPHSEVLLSSFDSGTNHGMNFGSTMRGYLMAPATGSYTFWICADESAELLLSTDADPANGVLRASQVFGANCNDWTHEPGQQSAAIDLVAGQIYYIEARHKEAYGGDHVQVAWQGPGIASREIISGTWLSPHRQSYAPWATEQAFIVREYASTHARIGQVPFIEPNLGQQITSHAITGGNGAGIFSIDSSSGEIRVANGAWLAAGGRHVLSVSATDDDAPAMTGSATVTIDVIGLQDRMHAWWRLDEFSGTTIRDSSGEGRDANLLGGGTWVSRGAANQALRLNGSDARVQHYGSAALFGDTSFTVAAWVKVPGSHAADAILIEQADLSENGGDGRYQVMVKADGRIQFSVYGKDANDANEGLQFDLTGAETIRDDTWHHVACVRDGSTGRIYIDAVEDASASGAIRKLNASTYVTLGGDSAGGNELLDATLDDIRIYAEALGSDQILRAANTPKVAIAVPAVKEAFIPSGVGLLLEAAASSPMGPEPALTWSKVSGPGNVTFAMSFAARFSMPGIYRLRASASNGMNSASDELTVIAGNSATSPFEGFTYGAGTTGGFQLSSPGNYRLQGASTGIDTSGAADGFYLLGQSFNGDFDLRTRVAWVMNFSGQEIGSAGLVVRQGTAGAADEASGFIGFDAWSSSGRWVRRAAPGENSVQSNYGMMRLPQWCRLTRSGGTVEFWHSYDGDTWLSRGTMTFAGEVRAGLCWSSKSPYSQGVASFDRILGFSTANIGPVVHAGGELSAKIGTTVDLAGVVSDDGFPGPPVTSFWSVVSGPGGVSIANPELAATTATFSQAGVHTLRLVANDGSLKTFDEVTITVNPLPVIHVAASDPTAAETGPDTGVFTISRSGPTVDDLTVNFMIEGSAINGVDYVEIPGTLLIPSGEESVTLSVIPAADELIEGTETVVLTIAEGPYEPGESSSAFLSIRDSNHAPFFLAAPVLTSAALVGEPYTGESLMEHTDDPNLDDGDTLQFEKLGGPDWLSIGLDGTLSGSPGEPDLGTNVFSVRVTDAEGLMADGSLQITVRNPSTYGSWQLARFGPLALEPLVAGESADPDQDGRSNLLEYALGTDPNHGDAARIEQEMVDVEGTTTMRLTYSTNPAAKDISLIVEGTSDLSDPNGWSDQSILIEEVTTAHLVVRDMLGGPQRFFHLRVSR
ncbi:MAG: cadherin domain-containing protein [Luteolibacter sp.]|jgi:hypothetical protein|nr:cadherin domain-containing protein [Luteolibacter sp.]